MAGMSVTVCGPNLRDQSKGTFHVHAAGCRDLRNYGARGRLGGEEPDWTFEAESALAVVYEVYADQLAEHEADGEDPDKVAEEWLSDFHFAPCLSGLPTRKDSGA